MRSISDTEAGLPPLRGEGASLTNYVEQLEAVKGQLDGFYDGNNRFKKHKWDTRRTRDAEYRLITHCLLRMVGGSTGRKRDEADKVVFGVGLGVFMQREAFLFARVLSVARPLYYVVVGVNDYYTSKKCPKCEEFIGQVEIRRLYCSACKSYMHRDIMAKHNICNAIRGHLFDQKRPESLQPVDKQGRLLWMSWIQGARSIKTAGQKKRSQ
ncbi:hypothetical protein BG011_004594 [Mortierella polycephala]|uniref:Cas12f1-like TNB domain-containing protein n=1 Tax=Mortierella polycephala TaxID=41804 RepID=A0A9P6PZR8_9FUNG|nr:hypothetical protein BG011_004594 [Mortierella polycephala]